ncbi:MAG: DegV family protein [Thermoleophilia bacterium]|nr:DegV family protein [Thermoleophilia bacterium]
MSDATRTRENTAIVVDSTADLPDVLLADPNLSMVPLNVHFNDDTFRDWVDIRPREFYARLRKAPKLPTTSQPSAGSFIEVYRGLKERFDHIYSIHLSGKLSGTLASATLAQDEVEGVTVLDSQVVTVAIALLAQRLLVRLGAGTTHDEIVAYVERYRRESGRLFVLDTLEYLQKGGRIGRASGMAGSLLNIKPLLTFTEGEVDAYKKVRGERKAMAAMIDYFTSRTVPDRPVHTAMAHADAPARAEEMLRLVRATGRKVDPVLLGEVGSVIGTYAGPGAVALFFIQE